MRFGFVYIALVFIGCQPVERTEYTSSDTAGSVWSIDLVRTNPGLQDVYLDNIRDNWAQARAIGTNQGALKSYRALAAPQDSTRGWDVILMTEYSDSTAWADRESIFADIFESDDFEAVPMTIPSDSVRSFLVGGVTLSSVADSRSD